MAFSWYLSKYQVHLLFDPAIPFLEICLMDRRRQWHPTPVLLPGKSHGQKSLVGCTSWGRYELDTTEWLHFHFSLSCIGGGNGNPLQCSCLENPGDGGAWWATIYGVTHSQTRLKWLRSSLAAAVQGTLKSLLQHHDSKASILQHSTFLKVQVSHPYMTLEKNHLFDYVDLCQRSPAKLSP